MAQFKKQYGEMFFGNALQNLFGPYGFIKA